MKEIIDFYLQLSQNNNKPWFDGHWAEYERIKKKAAAFAEDFIKGVELFDPCCKNLQVKDCTYRINRDIRFSNDKRPYKDWLGVYVCPKGKKSGMAGYYIHIEPSTDTYMLCGGLYNPTKEVLKSVREQIMLEPDEFHAAVQACGEGFELNWENAQKRFPVGYDVADKHSEYYRLRSYEIYLYLPRKDVLSKDFLSCSLEKLQRCHQLNELLNKCVDFVSPDAL